MKTFKNVLVGVDLSQGDRFVSDVLPPPTAEAIDQAIQLAKATSARITFFYAIDISDAARRLIEDSAGSGETVLEEANEVLDRLTDHAAAEGVEATRAVRFGASWRELIIEVLREQHDLVIVGTRHLTALQDVLLGSTGMKLLRLCPAPVWITQPTSTKSANSILVAHCLKEVGNVALDYGCAVAKLRDAKLHVLHSLEIPELAGFWAENVSAEKMAEYRAAAKQQIESQLQAKTSNQEAAIEVVADPPAQAVLQYIQHHKCDLLVMGTIARSGIAGAFLGNAAERLLSQIPCSLLAVKPADFETPVTIED